MYTTRSRFTLTLTNEYRGSLSPAWDRAEATIRNLTVRQVLAEIREFRRISGGCWIAYRITDRDGRAVSLDTIAAVVAEAECAAHYRNQ